jgi:hypothetical protein
MGLTLSASGIRDNYINTYSITYTVLLSSFGGGTRRVEVDNQKILFYIKLISLSTPSGKAYHPSRGEF